MKKLLFHLLAGLTSAALSSSALATVSLSLEPTPQSINVGQSAAFDLVVSGLGNQTSPSLGAFDIDLSYNPAILVAVSLAFGSSLDLGLVGSVRFSDLSVPGAIHLDEVSLESSSDLNAAQAATFTLATLHFTGLAAGLSPLDFTLATLSDEAGQALAGVASTAGSVHVAGSTRLPDASSTALLLVLALASMSLFRPLFPCQATRCSR